MAVLFYLLAALGALVCFLAFGLAGTAAAFITGGGALLCLAAGAIIDRLDGIRANLNALAAAELRKQLKQASDDELRGS